MHVQFLRRFRGAYTNCETYEAGAVAEVSEANGQALISLGTAQVVKPPKPEVKRPWQKDRKE